MSNGAPSFESRSPATAQERRTALGAEARRLRLGERLRTITERHLSALDGRDGSMDEQDFMEYFDVEKIANLQREVERLENLSATIDLDHTTYTQALTRMRALDEFFTAYDKGVPNWNDNLFGEAEHPEEPVNPWKDQGDNLLPFPNVTIEASPARTRVVLASGAYQNARDAYLRSLEIVETIPGGPDELLLEKHESLRQDYARKATGYMRAWLAYVSTVTPDLQEEAESIAQSFRAHIQATTQPLQQAPRNTPEAPFVEERPARSRTLERVAAAAGVVAAAGLTDMAAQMPVTLDPETPQNERIARSTSPEEALDQVLTEQNVIIEEPAQEVVDTPTPIEVTEAELPTEEPQQEEVVVEDTPVIDPYALYYEQGGTEAPAEEPGDSVAENEDPLAQGLY